ncbi:MAG: hypothetical protein ACTSX6_00405 [Candidatus Heimdallarchaeaceae archaeon]
MKENAIAYIETEIGNFALIPKVMKRGRIPKNFLVKMGKKAVKKRKEEGHKFYPAKVSCTETKTGAKLCLFDYTNTEKDKDVTLEGIEMCRPVFEMKQIVKTGKAPTIEECRRANKADFLIIDCKPEGYCDQNGK